MKGPAGQSVPESTFPSSDLTERLMRRATEPVGVIDVRHGQELHARTAGWVAQRFELLDHWKTGYAVDPGAPPAGQSLDFNVARMPFAGPFHMSHLHTPPAGIHGSASVSPHPLIMRSAADEDDSPPQSEPVSAPMFRVKRAGAVRDISSPAKPVPGDASGQNNPSSSTNQQPSLAQAAEIRTQVSSAPALFLQRNPVEAAPVITSKADSAQPSYAQAKELPTAGAPSAQMPLQRKPDTGSATVITNKADSPRPSYAQTKEVQIAGNLSPQMPLQRKPDAGAETVTVNSVPVSASPSNPAGAGTSEAASFPQARELQLAGGSSPEMHLHVGSGAVSVSPSSPVEAGNSEAAVLPQVRELQSAGSSSEMHLQRKQSEIAGTYPGGGPVTSGEPIAGNPDVQHSATTPGSSAAPASVLQVGELRTPGSVSSASMHLQRQGRQPEPSSALNSRSATVVQEIRMTPFSMSSTPMLWRKADTNGAGMGRAGASSPLVSSSIPAGGPLLMREIAPASAASPGTSTHASPAPSPHSGVDVTQIAEEVSRIIARQLAVERERRGKTR